MKPFDVWNKYCDHAAFEGAVYDGAFTRRLLNLRKQFQEGKSRAENDLEAFLLAKQNHPPPPFNHRGEPQWNGSEAQQMLEIDMQNGKHFELKPSDLWESRAEYQEFHLSTFRDHLHQADRTRKYLETLKLRSKQKEDKAKEKARKKDKAVKEKAARAVAKAAQEEERKRKAEERAAEKKRKEEEKAAEKQRKAAEKQRKAEEKAAEKKRKEEAKQSRAKAKD